ncbi:MAG: tryptophan synthase subunit alpha [Candidatus Omnitrophica bacterium]|nr:tryptophan synthase subunit alpha [Candidatus Omnitrophota bacterium]
MKNRLLEKMTELKNKKQKAFCAFLTSGYPDLKKTAEYAAGFEKEGVDILELGYPFSDPLADGPTIQFSSQQSLDRGISLDRVLKMLSSLRSQGLTIPVVFFSYYNPILAYGPARFVRAAVKAGFDAVLVPDLPPEEETAFAAECRKQGLCRIYLISPTTSSSRARMLAEASEGFIYYVSLRGVTGARAKIPSDIGLHLRALKKMTTKPVLIGFGVSKPQQARDLSGLSDGVIVGSAIVEQIRKAKGATAPVLRYIRQMVHAVKGC